MEIFRFCKFDILGLSTTVSWFFNPFFIRGGYSKLLFNAPKSIFSNYLLLGVIIDILSSLWEDFLLEYFYFSCYFTSSMGPKITMLFVFTLSVYLSDDTDLLLFLLLLVCATIISLHIYLSNFCMLFFNIAICLSLVSH